MNHHSTKLKKKKKPCQNGKKVKRNLCLLNLVNKPGPARLTKLNQTKQEQKDLSAMKQNE